jgi:hypothetical protein
MNKNKRNKMTKKQKETKIGFILSSRNDFNKFNDDFYKYLWSEYNKMSANEINIQFNYYLKR